MAVQKKILNSCKEVKILSNFVRANLHAQCKFASAEGTPREVRRSRQKISGRE